MNLQSPGVGQRHRLQRAGLVCLSALACAMTGAGLSPVEAADVRMSGFPADEGFWASLERHGWTARKDVDGSILLYPGGRGEAADASETPPARDKPPARASGSGQTAGDPPNRLSGLVEKLRATGWRVKQDSEGDLILRPPRHARPDVPLRAAVVEQPEAELTVILPDRDADGVADELDLCPATPRGQAVDGVGCAEGRPVVLSGVGFRTGSASLDAASMRALAAHGNVLRRHRDLKIGVLGHTDSVGDALKNLRLSLRRAQAVEAYLIRLGVPAGRVFSEGRGESQPIASNRTRGGRATNRRVELSISPAG